MDKLYSRSAGTKPEFSVLVVELMQMPGLGLAVHPIKTILLFRVASPLASFEGAEGLEKQWCGWGDSNARPRASETRALSC
jgi:hypothetical protein